MNEGHYFWNSRTPLLSPLSIDHPAPRWPDIINFVMPIRVATPPGFRFGATVTSHGWFQLAPFRWDPDTRTLARTEATRIGVVDLAIRHRGGALEISAESDLGPVRDEIVPRVRRMFQLDLDLAEFASLCDASTTHRNVARTGFGRLLCGANRFEDTIKIIATTNTRWARTKAMIDLLTKRFGERSPAGHRTFPSAETLARARETTVARHTRMGYRSAFVPAVARRFLEPEWIRFETDGKPTAQLFEQFRSLPGIGPYGAAHLLAMEGRHDRIAVDTEFRAFVRKTHFGGRAVSDARLLDHYRSWGRWKYLAYWSELWLEDLAARAGY